MHTQSDPQLGTAIMGPILLDVPRCPHCSVANPNLQRVWASQGKTPRQDGGSDRFNWGSYICSTCGSIVTVCGNPNGRGYSVEAIFPAPKVAHGDLPPVAKTFLEQAFQTLQAPDAAAMVAGSAVDAMLKAKGYEDGNLYGRIDKALKDGVLTQGMADWAHSVRLGSNRPRHADAARPHVSPEEAKQSVDFAEALGNFLFVITARIDRGIAAAQSAQNPT